VVALDLPGFGESEMPAGEISIPGYGRCVDELCDKLGLGEVVLVGNSMGGFVSTELALALPTRVAKLVLVAAAGLSIEYQRREPLLFLSRLWAALAARGATRSELVIRRARLRRAALQTVVRYPEKLSPPLAHEIVQGAGKDGFMPAMQALLDYSFRDRLAQLEMPVLIVWGENDILVPVDDAEEFERLIGDNARKVIFEDTGHMPMLERPGRFNPLLAEFLAGAGAPAQDVSEVSA
jgi:pimeloyl-ACP methyl ester carboxylesterase